MVDVGTIRVGTVRGLAALFEKVFEADSARPNPIKLFSVSIEVSLRFQPMREA